ncbi:malate/lactate/ureidoglycolate dehydrogenase [Roseomonas sp. CCTCC AB2023176]|uniref:malate/lactate/ureidoglycolate dehydrogenase n=1 Tax=Roseomonas sp. CCTCC AB2023176 TaxID=3342640 RepID=UPI0035DE3B05
MAEVLDGIRIGADALESFVARIMGAAGCAEAEATRVANHLVGANLRGHDSHGVVRVPRYVEWLGKGFVRAGATVEMVTDGGSFVLLDGGFGLGQTVAQQAAQLGITRATENGSCIVALRNAGHIGRAGDYAEMAIAAGLVSVHFVNVAGSVLVAPFGGVDRRFSTAPFSVGVPLPGEPLILDFATSSVAEGKVLVASNGGKPLPPDALIEPDGRLSGDPHTLYGEYPPVGPRDPSAGPGAIRAFGDHKGSGLALMCEMLAGCLTGGGPAGPIGERARIANGMLSIYLSPKHFGTEEEFHRSARAYADWVASSRPAEPSEPVLLPGQPETRTMQSRLREGVPLPHAVWQSIADTAAGLGVASNVRG